MTILKDGTKDVDKHVQKFQGQFRIMVCPWCDSKYKYVFDDLDELFDDGNDDEFGGYISCPVCNKQNEVFFKYNMVTDKIPRVHECKTNPEYWRY